MIDDHSVGCTENLGFVLTLSLFEGNLFLKYSGKYQNFLLRLDSVLIKGREPMNGNFPDLKVATL